MSIRKGRMPSGAPVGAVEPVVLVVLVVVSR
jgi:hypothetical protein